MDISIFLLIITLYGIFLTTFKKENFRLYGFIILFIANILWVVYLYLTKSNISIIFMYIILIIFSILGVNNNSLKLKIKFKKRIDKN